MVSLASVGILLGFTAKIKGSCARRCAITPPVFALQDAKAFSAACIRCGQCVQACPYDMLHLASLLSPVEAETPYFIARDKPCEMCPDIPCAKACPSGALDRQATDINKSAYGAVVSTVRSRNLLKLSRITL